MYVGSLYLRYCIRTFKDSNMKDLTYNGVIELYNDDIITLHTDSGKHMPLGSKDSGYADLVGKRVKMKLEVSKVIVEDNVTKIDVDNYSIKEISQ